MSLEGGPEEKPDSEPIAREREAERDIVARYNRFALRAVGSQDDYGSMHWVRNLGSFWQTERTAQGLTRVQVARSIGTTSAEIEYLELGLLFDHELDQLTSPNGLLERYSGALGDIQLSERCRTQFGLPTPPDPRLS